MSRPIFLSAENNDLAQLTPANEVAGMPATNVLRPQPFDRWRTTTLTPSLTFDWNTAPGAPFPISCVYVGYTNASAGATIRVRAGSNIGTVTSAPAFDSGVISHRPSPRSWAKWTRTHFLLVLSSPITRGTWRLDFNNVASADGYYEAGRVIFCDPWRPSRGQEFGQRVVPVESSQRRRSLGGIAHALRGGLYRQVELGLKALEKREYLEASGDLERYARGHRPIVVATDPENYTIGASSVGGLMMRTDEDLMDQCFYGYFSELPAFEEIVGARSVWRKAYSLEEVEHP